MSTLGWRIKQLVENEKISLKDWCRKYGLDYSTFQQITNDSRGIGVKNLMELYTNVPNVDLNWIVAGAETFPSTVNERPARYPSDPAEDMILKYLQRPKVQQLLSSIIQEEIQRGRGEE